MLPLIAFATLFILIHGQNRDPDHRLQWIGSFLLAAVFWGVIVIASAEILTLFRAVNRLWISITWLAATIILVAVGMRNGDLRKMLARIRRIDRPRATFDLMVLGGIALVAAILLVVAIIAPPNNVDSFLYHMARVVHWAQNESLEHYPAYIDHQLNKPIWAETAILHLRILWGSDRPANLVQWFSMLGSIIGVVGITGLLGADRKGRLFAALFALTIPMGLLQATSTQNDYVTAFWAVCLAYFVVLSMKRALTALEYLGLASAFGIGILTKGVFFVYFPPLLIWYFLNLLRKKGLLRTFGLGTAMLGIALVINFGFWARNIQTYGGPYGTSEWLQRNLGFDVDFLNRLFESEEGSQPSGGLQLRLPPDVQPGAEVFRF
ncbi:MAG: glycosyltransferase family 39 protein, partial [Anaerolineales bacterium]